MTKVKVLIYKVGQEPKVEEIDNTLEAMQAVVGGYIQAVPLDAFVDLICNEEGKAERLKLNRYCEKNQDVIVGDFFVSRHNEEGDAVDVTDIDVQLAKESFGGILV